MEGEATIAILSLQLNDALAEGKASKATMVAEQLRGSFSKDAELQAVGLPADATPSDMAKALQAREMTARAKLQPALEAMRRIKGVILAEVAKLGGNAALERVVELLEAGLSEASAQNNDDADADAQSSPLPEAAAPPHAPAKC